MYVYLIVNCVIFLTAIICENLFCKFKIKKGLPDVLYKLWGVVLLLLSAFRYGIGTDYWTYYKEYMNSSGKINMNLVSYVIRFLSKVHLPYQLVIIACSCLFLIPVMYLIYKLNYDYKLFSLGILMGFSYYVYSYNIFRQFTAIGLMFLFLYKWYTTSNKKYLFALILPAMIHSTSIIAIVVYFIISKIEFKVKIMQIVGFVGIAVFLLVPADVGSDLIKNMFQIFKYTTYSGYVTTKDANFLTRIYSQSMAFIPKMLIIPALIALPLIQNQVNYRLKATTINDETYLELTGQKLFIKVYFAYFMLMSLKIGSEIVTRFLMFFSIVEIFVIPFAFTYIENKGWNRWLKRALVLFIIFVSVYYHITWLNGNGCEAYPYQSVFTVL
jgi:hypothetical protein